MTAGQKVVSGCAGVLLVGFPVFQQFQINRLKEQVARLAAGLDVKPGPPGQSAGNAPASFSKRSAGGPQAPQKTPAAQDVIPRPWSKTQPEKSPVSSAVSGWSKSAASRPDPQRKDDPLVSGEPALNLVVGNTQLRSTMPNGHMQWDHGQATGPPDTTAAGDRPTAWAPRLPRSGEQWLQLGYEKSVELREINIHESYNSGAVSKVSAIMPGGEEKTLWTGSAAPGGADEILETAVPVPPGTTAGQIKVYVDTNRVASWPEIDAVEVVGTDGSRQWAKSSSASSSFSDSYSASSFNSIVISGEGTTK